MKKFYLLIQEQDEHGHFSAWTRPVTSSDNIAAIIARIPDALAVNIYPTMKEAARICDTYNKYWHEADEYKWDYMPDGVTPAPF